VEYPEKPKTDLPAGTASNKKKEFTLRLKTNVPNTMMTGEAGTEEIGIEEEIMVRFQFQFLIIPMLNCLVFADRSDRRNRDRSERSERSHRSERSDRSDRTPRFSDEPSTPKYRGHKDLSKYKFFLKISSFSLLFLQIIMGRR